MGRIWYTGKYTVWQQLFMLPGNWILVRYALEPLLWKPTVKWHTCNNVSKYVIYEITPDNGTHIVLLKYKVHYIGRVIWQHSRWGSFNIILQPIIHMDLFRCYGKDHIDSILAHLEVHLWYWWIILHLWVSVFSTCIQMALSVIGFNNTTKLELQSRANKIACKVNHNIIH